MADSTSRINNLSFTYNRVNNTSAAKKPVENYQRVVTDPTTNNKTVQKIEQDWRIKISLPNNGLFYHSANPGVMKPLQDTGGVVFPYTPSITVTNEASYESAQLTHSNYSNFFYKGSQISAISISSDFTVQNKSEAEYLLAAVFFLRATTKMFYGQGKNVGNPPVIVYLNGYGSHYFPNVPCVVTSFSHNLPADTDYLPIVHENVVSVGEFENYTQTHKTQTYIPTTSQITTVLQPIYSRSKLFNSYNLEDIANGSKLEGFI
jgi:hypothetical protein